MLFIPALASALLAVVPVQRAETPPLFAQTGATLMIDAAFSARIRTTGDVVAMPALELGDGSVIALQLERFHVVDPLIDVRIGGSIAPNLADAMRSVQHFRGTVIGEPGSLAYLAVSDRGAAGIIDRGVGRGRHTLRSTTIAGPGLVSGPARFDVSIGISAPEVPLCGTLDQDLGGGGIAGFGAIPPGTRPTIETAVDTDWEYFHIFDDATAAAEYVAALYGAISAIYERDVGARVSIVFTRFFDTEKDLFNEFDPLGEFRDWWNTNMTDVDRDVAHFLTGRRNLPYGGVAWLNATCGEFGYAVNGHIIGSFADPVGTHPGNWDINVTAHELGHNVGSLHTHSYGLDECANGQVARGSIMSYCHINSGASANIDLNFHRVCADEMTLFITQATCLESDCDGDGATDAEEIAANPRLDSNGDGIPDACQDCDGDGVPDPVAIAAGSVADVDGDGRPDGCEADCNANGVPDSLDILNGTSLDAYGNGIPDECEPDCNGNGQSDYTDIQLDMSIDRGRDAVIDACQDCDGDGVTDLVDLDGGLSIWTGDELGAVRELHPRSSVLLKSVTVDAPIYDLAIGPDGLLYASAGRMLHPIERATGAVLPPIIQLPGADAEVRGLAFGADGSLYVARAPEGVGKHALDGSLLSFLGGASGAAPDPRDVAIRADGRIVVTCGDGTIRQFFPNGAASTTIDGSAQPHDFIGVIETPDAQSLIVASRAQFGLLRFDATTGAALGRFDVQSSNLLSSPWGLALSASGTAILATSATSSSSLNGFNVETGYAERTYRSYPADAGPARAVIVAPLSSTDQNGNLVPDACEGVIGDLTQDGVVNGADLAILLGAWGGPGGDLNGDGVTDAQDLAILLGAWT
ncbi:MAG: M12 family metallo-peptidase [Phycisphaerae bacterium]|nr:M12 family metallo-peptidase [Phycisphaerae bacterium]